MKKANQNSKQIITAPIVEKSFIKKNGQPTGHKEVYIQLSVQDYFVKFCESEVTEEELKTQLEKISSPIKALKLEVEFRDGSWDICDDNYEQQSRIGKYAIINRILETK